MAAVKSEAGRVIISTLQNDVAFLRQIVKEQRYDIEFYRGKVERLELALMSNVPAQEHYAQMEVVQKPAVTSAKAPQQLAPRIPFSDLKQKWMAMSQEEQEQALQAGWEVDKPKEESNAG